MAPDIFSEPRVWHGAPTAALRRAFTALGSTNVTSIDTRCRDDLRLLQELYSREDPPVVAHKVPDKAAKTSAKTKRRERDDSPSPSNKSSKVRRTTRRRPERAAQGPGEVSESYVNSFHPTDSHPRESEKTHKWALGPSVSSWGAAERYQSLFCKNKET